MSRHMIELSQRVEAPPAKVWAVLTDLDRAQHTLSGVTRIERLSGDGYAVGTRWRETRKLLGKEATEEMWVTEVDPERRTVVKARSGGTDYTTVFTLQPDGAGTQLSMIFSGTTGELSFFPRLMMTLFGGLAMKATEKVMAQDLRDIAATATAG